MANKRILYATKRAGMGPVGSAGGVGTFQQIHGVQSVGITTTFNLEQTFELGQLAIYENIEGIPDVSIEIEKVLDGYCPAYILATGKNGSTTTGEAGKSASATLIGRSNAQCDFVLAIYKDTDEIAGDSRRDETGNTTRTKHESEAHVMMSGVFVNSVSYNIGIDGYATESVSLVGQDKVWYSHRGATWAATDIINSEDAPKALATGSGGVNRREDVVFEYPGMKDFARGLATVENIGGYIDENGAVSGLGTILPIQIPGISASGTNDKTSGQFGCHIQSINMSTDFGREDIFELGRKGRYHRFVPFPTEVTCEIGIISSSGDVISATEEGMLDRANGGNVRNETIRIQLREGLLVDLGRKNKLNNVSITGGDAGGGNEEISYSYTNFNDFAVYHPEDPLKVKDGLDAAKTNKFNIRAGLARGGNDGPAHARF